MTILTPLKGATINLIALCCLMSSALGELVLSTISAPPLRTQSSTPSAQSSGMILSPVGDFGIFNSLGTGVTTEQTDGWTGHIFRRDILTGTTRLLTRLNADHRLANGHSFALAISGNGRYLLAISDATNLSPNQLSGGNNLFRLDMETGGWMLINRDLGTSDGSGSVETAQISADGRFVLYTSANKALATLPAASYAISLYLFDTKTGITTLESSFPTPNSNIINYDYIQDFALTPDGLKAIYLTYIISETNVTSLLVMRDLKTHTSKRPSSNRVDRDNLKAFTISPDGRFFFFARSNTDNTSLTLTRGEFATTNTINYTGAHVFGTNSPTPLISSTNGSKLFLTTKKNLVYWDVEGTKTLVPIPTAAALGTESNLSLFAIGEDGNKVLYGAVTDTSSPSTTNTHLFLANVSTGQSTRITKTLGDGTYGDPWGNATMDPAAKRIVFDTIQTPYSPADKNEGRDIIGYDVKAAKLSLLTPKIQAGQEPRFSGFSRPPTQSIADDGSYAIYLTSSPLILEGLHTTNLALIGQNLLTGERETLSVDNKGDPIDPAPVDDSVLSRDGKFVLMLTTSTNMSVRSSKKARNQLILRDIANKTNHLASVDSEYLDGLSSSNSIGRYLMSGNGQRVIYTTAQNESPMLYDALTDKAEPAIRDRNGSTLKLGFNPTARTYLALSPDGRSLAFFSTSTNLAVGAPDQGSLELYLRDLDSGTNRWLPLGKGPLNNYRFLRRGLFAFSPDSSVLNVPLDSPTYANSVFIDVASGKPIPLPAKMENSSQIANATMSLDRQYIAYQDNFSSTNPIRLTHLASGETRLVSHVHDQPDTQAQGSMSRPSFSADGTWLTFTSTAADLAPGTFSGFPQIYLYNVLTDELLTASSSTFASRGANYTSGNFRIASGSPTLLFTSSSTDLKAGQQPSGIIDLYSTQLPNDPSLSRDSDADGLPDWWENRYIGTLASQGSDIGLSGMTLQEEYEQSVGIVRIIQIQASFNNATGELQITFPSIVGKSYRVEHTSDLSNTTWPNSTPAITATEATTTFVTNPQQDLQDQSAVYYKVVQTD